MQLDEFAIMGDAITTFGADAQQDKLLEEMAELQKEILKHRLGEDNLVHIAEEIADVEIMLEQMKLIFCCTGTVKAIRANKLHRLEQRILDARMEHAAEQAADPEVDHELFFG